MEKLPSLIKENISDINSFIAINSTLQNNYEFKYNDCQIKIFNYDFHDIQHNETLYYCAAKQQGKVA